MELVGSAGRLRKRLLAGAASAALLAGVGVVLPAAPAMADCGSFTYVTSGIRKGFESITNCTGHRKTLYWVEFGVLMVSYLDAGQTLYSQDPRAHVQPGYAWCDYCSLH